MTSAAEICSTFIEGAPAGEINEVVQDIKALTSDDDPALIEKLKPAFQKYNEEQLIAVRLPGGSQSVSQATYSGQLSTDTPCVLGPDLLS